jgi:PIN domain nuclease of toxin-antitoxin system
MARYVVDTQAIVKFLAGKKVISDLVQQIMEMADEGKNIIIIPSVVIFEIGYLHEKGRIPVSLNDIQGILDKALNYVEEPLSFDLIRCAFEITDIPELHDRLIAGTARHLGLPLITNDPLILESQYVTCVK